MERTPDQIKREIEALQAELHRVSPVESLSVRKIAKLAGVSVGTAQRFKKGANLDVPSIKALMGAGLIKRCPVCEAPSQTQPE